MAPKAVRPVIRQLLLALVPCFVSLGAQAQSINDQAARANVNQLINSGALELAVQTIDRYQGIELNTQWQSWERLRYKLYFRRQQYDVLQSRFSSYDPAIPETFRIWARGQLVNALLQQQKAVEARLHLRKLIWAQPVNNRSLAGWRRLLIESYLTDNRVDDADLALIQYQRDFPGRSPSWQVFRGRVLIRRGKYHDAYDVLTGVQRLDAKLYRLYAALESGVYKPAVVIKNAERISQVKYASDEIRKKALVLMSVAAARSGQQVAQLRALEQALNTQVRRESAGAILRSKPDDLWSAYEAYSEKFGNKKRLLVGDDAEWMRQAELLQKKDALSARALYAFLALRASVDVVREIAHKRFSESLYDDNAGHLVVALYTGSNRVGELEKLPDAVRYRLAIEVLRAGDIKLAASIMKTLKHPPAEESIKDWKLRRARTMVYAGEFASAGEILGEVLDENKVLDPGYIRRYSQVVFDLQAVGEHKAALKLFDRLYRRTKSIDVQRELLYWMAESRLASGEFSEAAELYLRSAYHGQPKGGDMWGQSARYHAAEALARAGYLDDARTVFEQLLKHTPDAKRRAVIERNLQQLWLKQRTNRTQ